MRADWVTRWRAAGIDEQIIDKFYVMHGVPPDWLTQKILNDDKRAGIGPIKLDSSPSIANHDIEMLLAKEGYAVTGNFQTQGRFVGGIIGEGIVGLLTASRALPYALIGGTVGGIIWAVREIF